MDGVLLINKPRGWTSHDVVSWVRRRLRTQQVGHGGTLDPAAEGLLVIAVGSATRLLQYALLADKSYVAHIVLGCSTTTDDLEGEPINQPSSLSTPPSLMRIQRVLLQFIGNFEQRPPTYAAKKVGGIPTYRKARRGIPIEPVSRPVTVYQLDILSYQYPDLLVTIDCSKGFYVRAFARDVGRALHTGAYLHGLIRARVGPFSLRNAWSIPDLQRLLTPETWPLLAAHPDTLISILPAVVIPEQSVHAWYHGAPVQGEVTLPHDSLIRVYASTGQWLGLGKADTINQLWRPVLVSSDVSR